MKSLALKIAAVGFTTYTVVFKLLFILFYGLHYLRMDFWQILIFSAISMALTYFAFFKKASSMVQKEGKLSESEVQSYDYYHEYDGTAIGINKSESSIYLKNGKAKKTYSFKEVRNWESSIQSNEVYRGYGMAGVAASLSVAANNKKNTGLFIDTRDIDNPKWTIRFKIDRNIEQSMARWTEILRQSINES